MTLFDFITEIKGVEYLIALPAIAVFVLLLELFKPRPFAALAEARADIGFVRWRSVARVLAAPFIGLGYLLALPFVMAYSIVSLLTEAAWKALRPALAFGWRPAMAYLLGRRRAR